jgi:hypothetical protein
MNVFMIRWTRSESYHVLYAVGVLAVTWVASLLYLSSFLLFVSVVFSDRSETVTLSAFILSGSSLKATLTFDGPIAESSVDSGLELFQAGENFRGNGDGFITHSEVIDFEHLAPAPDEEEEKTDDASENDEGPLDPNDPDIAQKRKERRERQRQKFLDAKAKRDKRKLELQKKVRQDGDPAIFTTKAPAEGWYRMCVQATWYQVCRSSQPWGSNITRSCRDRLSDIVSFALGCYGNGNEEGK